MCAPGSGGSCGDGSTRSQPSDVINPIDTARFLLEGRSEARLPVAFVRGRLFFSDERCIVEGVLVPLFRRATFDAMDEPTSPFNLLNDADSAGGAAGDAARRSARAVDVVVERSRAARGFRRRPAASMSRLSTYRGFDGFGMVSFEPSFGIAIAPAVVGRLVERYPRFTMIAGDVETVRGEWAIRGEVAAFVERQFRGGRWPAPCQASRSTPAVASIDAPASIASSAPCSSIDSGPTTIPWWRGRTSISSDRSSGRSRRDRWLIRAFGVVNPADRSAFLRALVHGRRATI